MAIELVSFPINSMVIFHSYVNVYQRVAMKLLNGPMVQWSNMIWSMCDKMARRGPSHLRNAYSMHGILKETGRFQGGRTTKTRLMSRT